MTLIAEGWRDGGMKALSLRCPNCRQIGTLEQSAKDQQLRGHPQAEVVGHRRCPNPDCHAYIWIMYTKGEDRASDSYPPERIDFDATGLPERVHDALDEAIACHSTNAFVAAAMLVRKTVEEVCADQEAEGKNLHERIDGLREEVAPALLDGLHDLRMLGNDAAHVESRTFDEVGEEEVRVGIDLVKLVLQSLYQLDSVVDALRALKKKQAEGDE